MSIRLFLNLFKYVYICVKQKPRSFDLKEFEEFDFFSCHVLKLFIDFIVSKKKHLWEKSESRRRTVSSQAMLMILLKIFNLKPNYPPLYSTADSHNSGEWNKIARARFPFGNGNREGNRESSRRIFHGGDIHSGIFRLRDRSLLNSIFQPPSPSYSAGSVTSNLSCIAAGFSTLNLLPICSQSRGTSFAGLRSDSKASPWFRCVWVYRADEALVYSPYSLCDRSSRKNFMWELRELPARHGALAVVMVHSEDEFRGARRADACESIAPHTEREHRLASFWLYFMFPFAVRREIHVDG